MQHKHRVHMYTSKELDGQTEESAVANDWDWEVISGQKSCNERKWNSHRAV